MPTTLPDNIYYPDISAAQNQPAYTGTLASSVQTALNARQRYTYVWTNAAALNAQTGMTEGSIGYRLDTKTEYQYENGAWRVATPHEEYMAANRTTPTTTLTSAGNMAVQAGDSTSLLVGTPTGLNGGITITDPGIYAISTLSSVTNPSSGGSVAVNGRSFLDVAFTTGADSLYRSSINAGEDKGSIAVPNLRLPGAGTPIYFKHYLTVPITVNVSTLVRITRIG